MNDPPNVGEDTLNVSNQNLPDGCCHLKRLCQTTLIKTNDDSICEYVLLLPYTQFGQSSSENHVVLECSNGTNTTIRACHATIRVLNDKLHGSVFYEMVVQPEACVYINYFRIEPLKPRRLNLNDCIVFGEKATNLDGFIFRFEFANEKLNYPVMRQKLRPDFTHQPENLILSNDSLNYRIGDLKRPIRQNDAPQLPLVSDLIYDLLCFQSNNSPTTNFLAKENVVSRLVSTPLKSTAREFGELNGNMLQLCQEIPVHLGHSKTLPINNKFDVDIYEVMKKIANRISKQEISFDSQEEKSLENANLQFPLIAPTLGIYSCSTNLTPSTSSSPPCSVDFRHTPSTSSSLFNNSDTSGYSTNNETSSNFTNNSHLTPSPVCVDEEKDEEKEQSLSKSASATSLQMLAALASDDYSKNETKPLEIFIPLTSCSDRDESLSPAQTLKPAQRGPKSRSSRQSTHENEEYHPHTTKQLKIQAGIETCKRRMLSYIANNMFTSQIVQHTRHEMPLIDAKKEVEEIKEVKPIDEQKIRLNEGTPTPLNLYPDGDEYVTKEIKTYRNSKKQTVRVDTITDADQRLFAALLLQVLPQKAPSTLDSSSASSAIENPPTPKEEKICDEEPKKEENHECIPSKQELKMFEQVEKMLPRIEGVGRHTVAKHRFLYRAKLDRTSPKRIATQRYRLIEKCRENRLKCEEKAKQLQERKQMAVRRKSIAAAKRSADQLPSPTGRNSLRSPIARMPIVKKSSTVRNNNLSVKRQSTDFSSMSVHQLVKDPNFDGFMSDESRTGSKDSFRFDEDEDPSSGKKASTQTTGKPFFATENARSAAILANVAIQKGKRGRKRKQPENPSDPTDKSNENKLKRQCVDSNTPKRRRGRYPKGYVKKNTIEKEEPCASKECSTRHVQLVATTSAIEWVACDACEAWFHTICALNSNRPVGENEKFLCKTCQMPEQQNQILN